MAFDYFLLVYRLIGDRTDKEFHTKMKNACTLVIFFRLRKSRDAQVPAEVIREFNFRISKVERSRKPVTRT